MREIFSLLNARCYLTMAILLCCAATDLQAQMLESVDSELASIAGGAFAVAAGTAVVLSLVLGVIVSASMNTRGPAWIWMTRSITFA
mgnify:CR=1 FL=1